MTAPARLNVMHVIETLDVGGAEAVVAEFADRFSGRFRSSICCLKRSGAMARRIANKDVEVTELRKKERGNDYRVPFRLAGLLRAKDIHVLQSHNWSTFSESAVAGLLAGTPVRVHMQHGETAPAGGGPFAALKTSVRFLVEGLLARGTDRIVAVSQQVKNSLLAERRIDPRRVAVIPNGIAVEAADPARVEERRREFGIGREEFVFVSVGRLAVVKNYPLLIESFRRLRERTARPLRLLIVGDGPEKAALERLIAGRRQAGAVLLTGFRDDVRELLAMADAFVLPSLSEGVSIALLEAMAQKRPVAATRVGGTGEVVVPGETGLLVESRDEAGMTDALLRLVEDEAGRRRMGESAHRRVLEHFNIARTAAAYESLYEEIWNAKRARSA